MRTAPEHDPSEPWLPPRRPGDDDLSSHLHRLTVGGLGFALPVLVVLIARWRHTDGLPYDWASLGSISAYHYSGATAVLAGVLVALAVFLFTYRGYKGEDGKPQTWDLLVAWLAGVAALGVAFFPTGAPCCVASPSWWTDLDGQIHHIAAATLFGLFACFALFLFPKTKSVWRRWLYRSCGVAIVACLVWAWFAHRAGRSIFWPETLALWAFSLSWLVKGRADYAALVAARKAVQHGHRFYDLVVNAFRR